MPTNDPRQIDLSKLAASVGVAVRDSRQALQAMSNIQAQHSAIGQQLSAQAQSLSNLANAVGKVQVYGGENPDIQRIENIPGRRVPFDYLVDIPIGPNITSAPEIASP